MPTGLLWWQRAPWRMQCEGGETSTCYVVTLHKPWQEARKGGREQEGHTQPYRASELTSEPQSTEAPGTGAESSLSLRLRFNVPGCLGPSWPQSWHPGALAGPAHMSTVALTPS